MIWRVDSQNAKIIQNLTITPDKIHHFMIQEVANDVCPPPADK